MSKGSAAWLAFSFLLSFGVCVSEIRAETVEWRQKMSDLAGALSETIPYLYPSTDQDPKLLTEKIKAVYEITRKLDDGIKHSMIAPDDDPALPYLMGMLRADFERAYLGVTEGHSDYAKQAVRASVSYCIACHTRTQNGVQFPLLKAFAEPLKRASWVEQIEFMTASRQFDSVLTDVIKKLKTASTPPINSLDLERASRVALSVAIRVKKDPAQAENVAQAVLKSSSSTFAMKEGAKIWLKDIALWKKENSKRTRTDKEMIAAARKLISHAEAPGVVGGHSEVDYLRASALVHDLIRKYPSSEFTAEALYIVGLSYDSLRELGLWSLQDTYYLACVDKAPHSELGEKCYSKYESSVTLGYSGSSGVHVPTSIRRHLDQVKKNATRVARE